MTETKYGLIYVNKETAQILSIGKTQEYAEQMKADYEADDDNKDSRYIVAEDLVSELLKED